MKLLTWMKQHPVQFGITAGGFTGLGALAIPNYSDEFTAYIMPWLGVLFFSMIAGPVIYRHFKKSVVAILVLSILGTSIPLNADEPPPPKQKCNVGGAIALGIGAGILVWIGVKCYRACQRIQQRREEREQRERERRQREGEEGDDQASARGYRRCQRGTCAHMADNTEWTNRRNFEFTVTDGNIDAESFEVIPQSEMRYWTEVREELNALGLPVTGDGYDQEYEIGGHITWDGEWTKIDNGGVIIRVEFSNDLEHWYPLLLLNAPNVPHKMYIQDSSEENVQFYRVVNGGAQ